LPGDITEGAPILGDAHSGQRWPIGVLVNAMIRYSDNIASNALISHFGFKAINATIHSAGMTGTLLARHFAGEVPPDGAISTSRRRTTLACCSIRSNAGRTKAFRPSHRPHRAVRWCKRCSVKSTAR